METERNERESPCPKRVIEALLFASDEPLSLSRLRRVLPGVDADRIRDAVEELAAEYDRDERSFRVTEIAGGYQLLTKPEHHPWVRRLRSDLRTLRLSRAAVETLAIVAYRQPVTRSTIEGIRGVDVGGVLRTLLDRNLATLKGRAEGVGRPLLYGTTDYFLNYFGLKRLDELPKIEELSEIMRSGEMGEVEAEVEEVFGPRQMEEEEAAGPLVDSGGPPGEVSPEECGGRNGEHGDGEATDAIAAGDR